MASLGLEFRRSMYCFLTENNTYDMLNTVSVAAANPVKTTALLTDVIMVNLKFCNTNWDFQMIT